MKKRLLVVILAIIAAVFTTGYAFAQQHRDVVATRIGEFPSLHIQADGVPFVERNLWIDSTFTMVSANRNYQFAGATGRIRGRG